MLWSLAVRLACREFIARTQRNTVSRRRPGHGIPPGQLDRSPRLRIASPQEVQNPLQVHASHIAAPAEVVQSLPDNSQCEAIRELIPALLHPNELTPRQPRSFRSHAFRNLGHRNPNPGFFFLHHIGQTSDYPEQLRIELVTQSGNPVVPKPISSVGVSLV